MYNEFAPIITGICVAAVLMLLEHIFARHLDFRVRYVLGMSAFLIGFAVWCWRTDNWRAWFAAATIAALSGALVLLAYALRAASHKELQIEQEIGRIRGRVEEANRATGIARTRDD